MKLSPKVLEHPLPLIPAPSNDAGDDVVVPIAFDDAAITRNVANGRPCREPPCLVCEVEIGRQTSTYLGFVLLVREHEFKKNIKLRPQKFSLIEEVEEFSKM